MSGVFTKHPPEKLEYWKNIVVKMQCVVENKGVSGGKPIANGFVYVQDDLITVSSYVMDTVISTRFS